MTAEWYYAIDGHAAGPISSEELRQRAGRGEISLSDLVWREGMPAWAPADSVGLATTVTPPPLPETVAPPLGASQIAPAPPPPVASPPPPAPPRGELPVVTTPVTAPQVNRAGEKPRKQAQPLRQSQGRQAAFQALWLTLGVAAILLCGFWIGHLVGKRAGDRATAGVTKDAPTVLSDAHTSPTSTNEAPRGDTRRPVAATHGPADSSPLPAGDSADAIIPREPADVVGPSPTPTATFPSAFGPIPAPATSPPATSPPATSPPATSPPATSPPGTSAAGRPAAPTNAPQRDDGPRLLFQTLSIDRQPTFEVLGKSLPQTLRYRIVSRLELAAHRADGSRQVVQTVERTYLDHADERSRESFASSLKALERQQVAYTLNSHREIIEFVGPKKSALARAVSLVGGEGVQLTSVIDDDGWKELAELTFFQPDADVAQGVPYVRQIAHDWGPLGRWSGTTTFTGQQFEDDQQTITFQHALNYTPPAAKAGAGPLGLRIVAADCTIDQADGMIQYDHRRGRVSTARETFRVHGTIATELLGQPASIGLQEQQVMTIEVTDQQPTGN